MRNRGVVEEEIKRISFYTHHNCSTSLFSLIRREVNNRQNNLLENKKFMYSSCFAHSLARYINGISGIEAILWREIRLLAFISYHTTRMAYLLRHSFFFVPACLSRAHEAQRAFCLFFARVYRVKMKFYY